MGNRHRLLLGASFLYLAVANLIWIAIDTRPPYWDTATHSLNAIKIYNAFSTTGIRAFATAPFLTDPYPPLYHFIVATFYAIFGRTIDAAEWANLPAIAILLLATYGVGRSVLKPLPAAIAAVIVSFYPLMLWLSREALIDYWLTALVALAMWVLIRTKEFEDRRWAALFGVLCGLGMLTKWTFVFFLALPAIWLARKNFKNAVIAAAIAAIVAGFWYVPAAGSLSQLLQFNTAQSVAEGDPNRFSLDALVFYVRALEGSQLFMPLFVAFLAGALLLLVDFDRKWIPILLWIAGGWIGLLLFQNKDPRYTAPFLPAAALITAQVFQKKPRWVTFLLPLLALQHYLVSFGIPQLPEAVALVKGSDGPVSYDWNLYTQRYFGWGPPAREDWKIEHVLKMVARPGGQPARVGLIPDIPHFDKLAFQFYIEHDKLPVTIERLVTRDAQTIAANDYILALEKQDRPEPGAHFTPELLEIGQYVRERPESFRPIEHVTLPNGNVIGVYEKRH